MNVAWWLDGRDFLNFRFFIIIIALIFICHVNSLQFTLQLKAKFFFWIKIVCLCDVFRKICFSSLEILPKYKEMATVLNYTNKIFIIINCFAWLLLFIRHMHTFEYTIKRLVILKINSDCFIRICFCFP